MRGKPPKSEEDEEEETSYAGETEREQHRKWREIKAVLMDDGKQCETCICNDDEADPGGHGLENGAIDTEQEHGKAGKEEKKRMYGAAPVILRPPWEFATFRLLFYRMHEYVLAFEGGKVGRQPFHSDVPTAVAMSPIGRRKD
jgi:hypothetical protein